MKYLRYKEELDAIFKKPKAEQQSLLEAESLWVCDRCSDVVNAEKNDWDYDMYSQEYLLCPHCRERINFEVNGSPREEDKHKLDLYEEKVGRWVKYDGNIWDYENQQRKLERMAKKISNEIEKISGVNYELLGPVEEVVGEAKEVKGELNKLRTIK